MSGKMIISSTEDVVMLLTIFARLASSNLEISRSDVVEVSIETLGRHVRRRCAEGCAAIRKKSARGNDTSFEVPRTDGPP